MLEPFSSNEINFQWINKKWITASGSYDNF